MSPLSSFECDRSKIEAIEEAFDAVWTTIQASEPDRDLKTTASEWSA